MLGDFSDTKLGGHPASPGSSPQVPWSLEWVAPECAGETGQKGTVYCFRSIVSGLMSQRTRELSGRSVSEGVGAQ